MNGKVVVVTGASGALGKVVAEVALARGARVAGIDHAPSQTPAASNRIESAASISRIRPRPKRPSTLPRRISAGSMR